MQPQAVALESRHKLHVLTLTPFYPRNEDDTCGCFISEPLRLMPELGVSSTVISVHPVYRQDEYIARRGLRDGGYLPIPGNLGLSSAGLFLYAGLRARLHRLHRARPFDVIHAHAALPCGQAARILSRDLRIPFVVSVHGLDAFATQQVRGLPGRWCETASRKVYVSARSVICVSEHVKQCVLAGMKGTPVACRVAYNGVDPMRFSPGQGGDNSEPVILSVGNLHPIKGHELVVRAVAALKDTYSDLRYEIIGMGPEAHRLRALAEKLDIKSRVIFLGRCSRQEVADKMRQCSVFVLPSRYEALGCVYLEAMACGKATIGCHGQGISEIIRHGENGWLIKPESLAELVDGLFHLLGNPSLSERLGREGRRTTAEQFTLHHQAEHWLRIYRECIA